MGTNKTKQQGRIVKSGEMMQGICIQWFFDTHGLDNNGKTTGLELYVAILRKTFGYRQRFNYIPQSFFKMSPNRLKRNRDRLTELGLIEWKKTKQMTMYKILEPAQEIKNFVFVKNIDKNNEEYEIYGLPEKVCKHIDTLPSKEALDQYLQLLEKHNQGLTKLQKLNAYAYFNKEEPVKENSNINVDKNPTDLL